MKPSTLVALADRLDPAAPPDAVAFMAAAGLHPDPWQQAVLTTSEPMLLLCCRQSGKSTTTAALALHVAVTDPGALVLLLSPSQRQSGELFRKVQTTLRAQPQPIDVVSEQTLSLALANGSRVVALPGAEGTVRGFSGVRLLVIDEAARVDDALYRSVRPMLAVSGGRLIAMTTPWGKRGWFHEEWSQGGKAWRRVKVTAAECPRISPKFLDQERASLGDWWFRQEYLCEFVDATSQFFSTEDVERALSHEIEPLFPIGGGRP